MRRAAHVDSNLTQVVAASGGRLIAKYGLPLEVKFCSRCVISNQRPNSTVEFANRRESLKPTIRFEDGVCDACRYAEMKARIDWSERERELKDLCDRFRKKDGFDCLVPGSGGKDSFYAAHILKTKFGMHPLTVTWAPHIHTDWGWRNFQRWIHAGFDNILYTPNGAVHRLLTRLAVNNLFHPFQPFMIGQKGLAPKMAKRFGIDLVFYGENEAEYGNPIDNNRSALRDASYFERREDEIYLGGVPCSELRGRYGLCGADLEPYMPMYPSQKIQVHYLGYYLKWHPQSCYYHACEHGGFEASPERTPGTYSKYNSIDDKIDDLHYFTTYIKFGIGRATYDAAQEIRSGDITREEGVSLVHRFDGEYPERFEAEVFDYLNLQGFPRLDRNSFLGLAETFKSPHLWDGKKLRHAVA